MIAELRPCAHCGGTASFFDFDDPDQDVENFGGTVIVCNECGISTKIRFSIKEDARPLLAECWNRRTHTAPVDEAAGVEVAEWRPVSELPLPDRDDWGVPYVVGRWMTLNRFDPPKWIWKAGFLTRTDRTYGQEPDKQCWTVFWTDDCSAQSERNGLPAKDYPTHYLRQPAPPALTAEGAQGGEAGL